MAGDWIKMRGNLWDDPRVSALVDATDSSEAAVIGGLYWLWSTADQHTEDGIMPGLTLRQIDRKTGIPGFGAALCSINWLADHPEGVRLVNFTEHNGSSAKRRATESQRKANSRNVSASDADNQRTDCGSDAELEKRREEKKETPPTPKGDEPPGFSEFWKTWPSTDRKQAKGKCLDAWKKASAERDAAVILAHVESLKNSQSWLKNNGEYIPAPLVYLGQRRWEGAGESQAESSTVGVYV